MFKESLPKVIVAVAVVLLGVLSVSLVALAQTPNADRSFSSATVEPGGQVTVTITAADYGQAGGVTETLPAGFTYACQPSLRTARLRSLATTEVRFTLQGDTSFTYTVTASSTAGDHTFSGTLRDFERDDYAVGGETVVTVEAAQGDAPSAGRSFDSATVAAGGTLTVTITAANYGQAGGVTETLPAGFTYACQQSLQTARLRSLATTRSGSPSRGILPLPTPSRAPARRVPIPSPAR